MNLILKAARFANKKHEGQFRKYYKDVPYITHPARVAAKTSYYIAADEEMVCAAWLHDVIEDCGVKHQTLVEEFNYEIANLVRELSNPGKKGNYPHLNRKQRKLIDHNHISQISHNAKVIKAIDRIDNLNDIPPTNEAYGFARDCYLKESTELLEVLKPTIPGYLTQEFKNILQRLENAIRDFDW